MGLTQSLALSDEDLKDLQISTGCYQFVNIVSVYQIRRLYTRFLNLDKKKRGYLTREDFLGIPELAINPLSERLVDMFYSNSSHKPEEEGINFKTFLSTLSVFKPISKKSNYESFKDNKLRFVFNLYDIENKGYLTRQSLFDVLNLLVYDSLSRENLDIIVDHVFNDADMNNDGKISYSEFVNLMQNSEIEEKLSIAILK